MRLRQLIENGGRIVKGVNTTPDVGTDEIKKQAKKFGFSVDKDGKPAYTMHKKAMKNTNPNTLYNLGLAESLQRSNLVEESLGDKTEIYIDMDGVLADFFSAWEDLMGVDHYRKIDNVENALQAIRDKDNFWLNLEPTPNSGKLLALVKELKGEYNILSAPLAGDPRAEKHKKMWVEKYLKQFPPKNVIITADKQLYAKQADGTPNILIDDYGSNIAKWNQAGGIGVKHKDYKFERTFNNLMHYLDGHNKIFKRNELPQIGKKELSRMEHTLESVDIRKLRPVQVERFQDRFTKKMEKYSIGKIKPIIVDENYKIINGHHRYDVAMYNELYNVRIAKLHCTLESLIESLNEGTKHQVARGDTLFRISQRYNVSIDDLKSLNDIQGDVIQLGQILDIPTDTSLPDTKDYEILPGDTFSNIARKMDMSAADLMKLNPGIEPTRLQVGDHINIPKDKTPAYKYELGNNLMQAKAAIGALVPNVKPHHVVGILANLVKETGIVTKGVMDIRPMAVNPDDKGAEAGGLAQWRRNSKDDDRLGELHKFYKDNEGVYNDHIGMQIAFMAEELMKHRYFGLAQLIAQNNSIDAARVFARKYLRPDSSTIPDRLRIARDLAYSLGVSK
jgi:LysM repeat protein/5'(3')-deoxyribonucleotidase